MTSARGCGSKYLLRSTREKGIEHPRFSNAPSQQLPDFGDEAVRRRLGPSTLTLIGRIVEAWHLPGEDVRQLLVLQPETDLGGTEPEFLSEEQLLRMSYLIGIYVVLHRLHSDTLADEWVRIPNTNAILGGRAPVTYMIQGGVDALRNVRRLLEACGQGC